MRPFQVHAARTALGLTQEAMAKEMRVTLRTFQRWEKQGVDGPAAMMIEAMLEAATKGPDDEA
jgi:DNA-binding transcriptional regulator YiaG